LCIPRRALLLPPRHLTYHGPAAVVAFFGGVKLQRRLVALRGESPGRLGPGHLLGRPLAGIDFKLLLVPGRGDPDAALAGAGRGCQLQLDLVLRPLLRLERLLDPAIAW